MIFLAVENEGESDIQERIVLNHRLDNIVAELKIIENFGIGGELHERTVFHAFIGGDYTGFRDELPLGERGGSHLPVADGADEESRRKGICRLHADTVEPNGSLIILRVEFSARVHERSTLAHIGE